MLLVVILSGLLKCGCGLTRFAAMLEELTTTKLAIPVLYSVHYEFPVDGVILRNYTQERSVMRIAV
jgi:hypothetical protein